MTKTLTHRTRWLALMVLCLGDLMIVLDTTIVNVALPSIRADLAFTETSLVWVVNAYMLTFGGFLLLGGRLGDLYGQRRLFLIGIALFTLASLACGLATGQAMLIVARAVQGLGGAVVSAVALSLIMTLFTEPGDRARAMGFFGFVMAGGGSIGVLLGGVLTDTLSWHWIFLVNLPIGIAVAALTLTLLPADRGADGAVRLDVGGAVTITLALLLAVYAVVNGGQAGWTSTQTIGLLGGRRGASRRLRDHRVAGRGAAGAAPPVPAQEPRHRKHRRHPLVDGDVRLVLPLRALHADGAPIHRARGRPRLPPVEHHHGRLLARSFCQGRDALWHPLAAGARTGAGRAGLVAFAFAPVDGDFLVHVLPGMVLLGIGVGLAFNPVLLAAMSDVDQSESGLASGVVNTAFMMGGALGLAVLASLAAAVTEGLIETGATHPAALTGGYHAAFIAGAVFAGLAALLAAVLLRAVKAPAEGGHGMEAVPADVH